MMKSKKPFSVTAPLLNWFSMRQMRTIPEAVSGRAWLCLAVGVAMLWLSGCMTQIKSEAPRRLRSLSVVPGKQSLGDAPYRTLASLLPPHGRRRVADAYELAPAPKPKRPGVVLVDRRYWGYMIHRVRSGDSLFLLARQYYGQEQYWKEIVAQNRRAINAQRQIRVGQLLYLPLSPLTKGEQVYRRPGRLPDYYIVAPGDTLSGIAELFLGNKESWKNINRVNSDRLAQPQDLAVGMVLIIPKH